MPEFEYYIFFEVDIAQLDRVVQELLKIPQLKELVLVTGQFDLVAHFVTERPEDLKMILVDKLSAVPGIEHTITATVIERYR